ncbi:MULTISPECIES: hypothetical protein [unclassified Shinella]|nr:MULTISPECIES: hypothetical protein [unclassified Shinella]
MAESEQEKPPFKFYWKRNAIIFLVSALLAFAAMGAISYFFGPM